MLQATLIIVTLWISLIGGFSAAAQESASVEGMVVQVSRLSVTLVSRQTGQRIDGQVVSGNYVIRGVPPGSYDLKFGESAAFSTTIRRIEFAPGERKQLPPVGLLFHPGCQYPQPAPEYLELLPIIDRDRGSLSETIVDETNNVPISGVDVFLYSPGKSGNSEVGRSMTDSAGRYRFDGLAAGKYWVRFQASGYFPNDYGAMLHLVAQAGFNSTHPIFTLERCEPGKCEPSMRRIEAGICE